MYFFWLFLLLDDVVYALNIDPLSLCVASFPFLFHVF